VRKWGLISCKKNDVSLVDPVAKKAKNEQERLTSMPHGYRKQKPRPSNQAAVKKTSPSLSRLRCLSNFQNFFLILSAIFKSLFPLDADLETAAGICRPAR
jgi:hypothetical protein